MTSKLPLVNLSNPASWGELKTALHRFGAFRLAAPEITQDHHNIVIENARKFFKEPMAVKRDITGYSPFASERVRGRTEIPKESIYFFRDKAESTQRDLRHIKGAYHDLYRSVKSLSEEWTLTRLGVLNMISETLDPETPLTGTTHLDSATIGVHYYDSHNLTDFSTDFSPPHKDSGTLTILFRSHDEKDGLEIADLESTDKQDSAAIGSEASFVPVPTSGDGVPEVVVFAGLRLQTLLGRNLARACVHRVRCPDRADHTSVGVQRFSIAMFCAPSMPSRPSAPTPAFNLLEK